MEVGIHGRAYTAPLTNKAQNTQSSRPGYPQLIKQQLAPNPAEHAPLLIHGTDHHTSIASTRMNSECAETQTLMEGSRRRSHRKHNNQAANAASQAQLQTSILAHTKHRFSKTRQATMRLQAATDTSRRCTSACTSSNPQHPLSPVTHARDSAI